MLKIQRRHRLHLVAGAGAVVSLLCNGVANGQELLVLPDMVVTASRTAVAAREVGAAMTVITAEEIERKQLRFVSDVLRDVPGLAVNRTGTVGGLTQLRIRGAEGNHTLVIIDGVEVNDPANGSEFDFSSLLADDIERIEVLRGPQSAIWGSDAIGGVVNIVTKRGRKGLRGHASTEGGSFGTYRLNAGISGGNEQVRGSVSGSLFETNGIDVSGAGGEKDGYENGTLNVTGDVDLNEHLTVSINGRYTKAKGQTDRQDFDFPPTPTQGLVVDSDNGYEAEQFHGRTQARLRLFDGAWEQVIGAAVTRAGRDNLENGAVTSESTGTKGKIDYQSTFAFETEQVVDAAHSLTFYAEREHEDFRHRSANYPAANQYRDTTDYAYVAEYRVGLWDQLFLSGALRFDDNDQFKDATTWRGTAAYVLPESGTRLHGSYGTGVTNPTFFELFGFDPGTFIGNPNLKPEKSEGWDIGIEQKFFGERLAVDVTYFEADLQDEIQTAYLLTFESTPVNLSGRSKRRGVEATAKARVTEDLDLSASFTWLDAKEPSGRTEVRRPKYLASAAASYRFLEGRAHINISADYNGRMQDNEFVDATSRTRVALDDFILVNVAASYLLTDRVEIFGRIENLLDQTYQEVYSFHTPGIGAFAGIRVAFDGL